LVFQSKFREKVTLAWENRLMGKNPFTKAQQIAGLKKSIANPKTPKAFLPSMRKRLAKLTRKKG